MTDQPRTAASDLPNEPLPAKSTDGGAPGSSAIQGVETTHPSDAVHVFTGSELPEPGPAEALSSIEDPSAGVAGDGPAAKETFGPGALPEPARASSVGMPALLGSSLLAGLIGAGAAMGAQTLWLQPSARLKDRVSQLEQRIGATASQDLVGANERRLAAIDAEMKALDGRIRAAREVADAGAKRADEALNRPPPAPDAAQAAAVAQAGTRLAAVERVLTERTQAAAAVQSAIERRQADQDGRLAGLARQLADMNPQRLDAGLRVIASDRVAAALREGQPLGPYLPMLERLKIGAPALSALQSYATAPPPSAAALLRDFKPVAERIRAETQPAPAGDWSGKLLGLADQVVTIRQTTPAPGGAPQDAVARIESALNSGALAEAATAWDGLPETVRAASQGWGEALKRRVAADAAARQVSTEAVAAFDAATR